MLAQVKGERRKREGVQRLIRRWQGATVSGYFDAFRDHVKAER